MEVYIRISLAGQLGGWWTRAMGHPVSTYSLAVTLGVHFWGMARPPGMSLEYPFQHLGETLLEALATVCPAVGLVHFLWDFFSLVSG